MEPRIYVASLSHYNNGMLVGKWFDAWEDTLEEDVQEYLESLEPPYWGDIVEEWAIHDFEKFGPFKLSEHESLEDVQKMAELLYNAEDEETAEIYGILISDYSKDYDELEDISYSIYRQEGAWTPEMNFAYECNEDNIPDHLVGYIDWEAMGRDYELNEPNKANLDDGSLVVFHF